MGPSRQQCAPISPGCQCTEEEGQGRALFAKLRAMRACQGADGRQAGRRPAVPQNWSRVACRCSAGRGWRYCPNGGSKTKKTTKEEGQCRPRLQPLHFGKSSEPTETVARGTGWRGCWGPDHVRYARQLQCIPSVCGSIPARHSTRCQHIRFTSSLLGAMRAEPPAPPAMALVG